MMSFNPKAFYFPDGSTAETAFFAQKSIYRSDYFEDLLPYFAALESKFVPSVIPKVSNNRYDKCKLIGSLFIKKTIGPIFKLINKNNNLLKADMLVVGDCSRNSEINLMKNIIIGLVNCDKSIIYIVTGNTEEYFQIKEFVDLHKFPNVMLIDPFGQKMPKVNRYIQRIIAYEDAVKDLNNLLKILPEEISVSKNVLERMIPVATAHLSWQMISNSIQYETVFLRNHWTTLSSCVALESLRKGKTVITTQHGVISSPCTFIPILATHQVCFGDSSINVLKNLEKMVNDETNRSGYCKEYISAGSSFDEISDASSNYHRKSLLVFDQHTKWSEDFYGISEEYITLVKIIENVADMNLSIGLKKIIIRLHPDNSNADEWKQIAKKYPDLVEISFKNYTLIQDIERSSISIGLFSGALALSAACGIPAFFLWEQGWYYTPDLSPFYPDLFIAPNKLIDMIREVVDDEKMYNDYQKKALINSKKYYCDGKTCNFKSELFKKILEP